VHKNLETVLGPAGLEFGFAKLVVLTNAPIENTPFQAVLGWFAGGYSCRAGKAPPPLESRREAMSRFCRPPDVSM
jgi:hypothetical protein